MQDGRASNANGHFQKTKLGRLQHCIVCLSWHTSLSLFSPSVSYVWGLVRCRPVTLEGLLKLRGAFPDAKLVGGNTEVGIEVKFKAARYPTLVSLTAVPELRQIQVRGCWSVVGATPTLIARCSKDVFACSGCRGTWQPRWASSHELPETAGV